MIQTFFSENRFKIISVVSILFILFLMMNFSDNREQANTRVLSEVQSDLNVQIPEYCKLPESCDRLNDSMRRVRNRKEEQLRSAGNVNSIFFFGASKIKECDSCNTFKTIIDDSFLTEKYFIQLQGFTLKQDATFFIEKGKYFIRYQERDTGLAVSSINSHSEVKQIGVRYSIGNGGTRDGSLLIPVSKTTYLIIDAIAIIFSISAILCSLYFLVVLPYAILMDIAKGIPFTMSNVKRLRIIGWIFVGLCFLNCIGPLLLELFLENKIPKQIYFPFLLSLSDSKPWIIVSIIVLLLASAFKQGYKLQQEQDLTI